MTLKCSTRALRCKAIDAQQHVVHVASLQDFLFRYRDRVEAVTADQVVAAAKRHLHPDQQLVVVVGDAAVVAPQLKEAGFEVQPLKPVPAN